MRFFLAIVVLLATLSFAQSVDAFHGKLLVTCTPDPSSLKQVDPMVSFGQPASDHLHIAYGAQNVFGAATMLKDLLYAQSSTCNVRSDKSLIWTPVVVKNGQPIQPTTLSYYVINNGNQVVDPAGIGFVAGNPNGTTNGDGRSGQWQCVSSTLGVTQTTPTLPATCPAGTIAVQNNLYSSPCWSGRDFGPGFGGQDAIAATAHVNTSVCSQAGSLRIPQFQFNVRFPASAIGGRLSSDDPGTLPGSTWHLDYKFGWSFNTSGELAFPRVIDRCLNNVEVPIGGLSCRVVNGRVVLESDHSQAVTD